MGPLEEVQLEPLGARRFKQFLSILSQTPLDPWKKDGAITRRSRCSQELPGNWRVGSPGRKVETAPECPDGEKGVCARGLGARPFELSL